MSTHLPGTINAASNANGISPLNNAMNQHISKATTSKPNGVSKNGLPALNKNSSPVLAGGLMQKNGSQQPLTTGELLANGLQLSVAPVRRYKQYTEETLQQALREIMEGQRYYLLNNSAQKLKM